MYSRFDLEQAGNKKSPPILLSGQSDRIYIVGSVLRKAENKKETHYRLIVSLLLISDGICQSMKNCTFLASDSESQR